MNIEHCKCPQCEHKLLYVQSKLNDNSVEIASTTVNLQYAIQCYWCSFSFGDYNSKTELFEQYNKLYGGNSNG